MDVLRWWAHTREERLSEFNVNLQPLLLYASHLADGYFFYNNVPTQDEALITFAWDREWWKGAKKQVAFLEYDNAESRNSILHHSYTAKRYLKFYFSGWQ